MDQLPQKNSIYCLINSAKNTKFQGANKYGPKIGLTFSMH